MIKQSHRLRGNDDKATNFGWFAYYVARATAGGCKDKLLQCCGGILLEGTQLIHLLLPSSLFEFIAPEESGVCQSGEGTSMKNVTAIVCFHSHLAGFFTRRLISVTQSWNDPLAYYSSIRDEQLGIDRQEDHIVIKTPSVLVRRPAEWNCKLITLIDCSVMK